MNQFCRTLFIGILGSSRTANDVPTCFWGQLSAIRACCPTCPPSRKCQRGLSEELLLGSSTRGNVYVISTNVNHVKNLCLYSSSLLSLLLPSSLLLSPSCLVLYLRTCRPCRHCSTRVISRHVTMLVNEQRQVIPCDREVQVITSNHRSVDRRIFEVHSARKTMTANEVQTQLADRHIF